MHGLAHELKSRGINVLLLHPGWVRTRMGGSCASISPEESVRGMRSRLDHYALNLSGGFFRFDGARMPW
jgi:NAD(P)-dependent dehydrogenase (short-subunit alcohol dehydrogenase family)